MHYERDNQNRSRKNCLPRQAYCKNNDGKQLPVRNSHYWSDWFWCLAQFQGLGDVIDMKKRIFCDHALLLAVIVFAAMSSTAIVGTMFGIVNKSSVANPSEIVSIRIMFGALLLGLWLALIASSPRFLCTLTLSQTAITVWMPFRKSETISYAHFKFIYCGKYFHGNIAGMGKDIWYIVIAQRRLTSNDLNAINHVQNSKEVVKIRYTEKTVKKLKSILPSNLILQLDCAIAKNPGVSKRNNGTTL